MAKKISKAGQQTDGGLACPKCGGTSFKPIRSKKGMVMAGALAPKTRVKCDTCGEKFKRG